LPEDSQPPIDEEAVAELLETVRALVAAETSRSQTFDTKNIWLGGFAGTILSLTATLGRAGFDVKLGDAANNAFVAFYVSAAVLLSLASLAAISVLLPKSFFTIATSDVERYPFPPLIGMKKVMVQGRTMRGLIEALKRERIVNAKKANRTRIALLLLGTGLLCVAGEALILGFNAL
jgi:hypothetical protein